MVACRPAGGLSIAAPTSGSHERGTAATFLREHGFGRDAVELLLAYSEKNATAAAYSHMEAPLGALSNFHNGASRAGSRRSIPNSMMALNRLDRQGGGYLDGHRWTLAANVAHHGRCLPHSLQTLAPL